LVNVPQLLVPTLHETIYEEIQWAIEDGNPFEFDSFIYLAGCTHEDAEGLIQQRQAKKRKKNDKKWPKQEDYIYLQHSTMHFTIPVTHSETRVVMTFPATSVPSILQKLQTHMLQFSW